jgi:hypothetical protein
VEKEPPEYPIEIKVRFELDASWWIILASNAIALLLAIHDLMTWLIQ